MPSWKTKCSCNELNSTVHVYKIKAFNFENFFLLFFVPIITYGHESR